MTERGVSHSRARMQNLKPIIKPEPKVDLALAQDHGLTAEEYQRIQEVLGRIPTYTELGIFSVMWSEHCSYKNSIALLKTLPRSGGRLLVSAGEENAGLVDIGDGQAVAFKIESHNHPSAVEPYQGAATGVGGILRDIFSMGARPIAILDSLRFGDLSDVRVRQLVRGVVKGIGDYGNSFGVPTVAGEVGFDRCYQGNPLVNAMAVGIVEHDAVARAVARGTGNTVMIVGSSTGRDGIHGATFASEEISERSEAKRPAVQVGDPFTEKLLLEATLEAIRTGHVIGVQDMGAAGITCSTSEMSAKGGSGMNVELARIPLRESGMTAYEILLSESQERMLFIVDKGHEEEVNSIFRKWDLHAEVIGTVEDEEQLKIFVDGALVANVPPQALVLGGGAPVYKREMKEPAYLASAQELDLTQIPEPKDYNEALMALLQRPNIASKRWVYEQYDSMVRTNSVVTFEGDAAVVRIKGTAKGLAVKTDCNARYVYLHPRRGAQIAVAEAARNVVCVGAAPLAITNCLNFGNPYDPEVYWQFAEAVAGMGEACRVLGTPVTGGNVSFYNESPAGAIYPTPVIGMLGLLEDVRRAVSAGIKRSGDLVLEIGRNLAEIGASEYVQMVRSEACGLPPALDLTLEKRVQEAVLELMHDQIVHSAHDVADGGIMITLAESLMAGPDGLGMALEETVLGPDRADFGLFGESQSRIVITVPATSMKHVEEECKRYAVPCKVIGVVNETGRLVLRNRFDLEVASMRKAYERAIPELLGE